MCLFAETAYEAISGKVMAVWKENTPQKQIIITTSSFPARSMFHLGGLLENFALREQRLKLTFKIANNLGEEWKKNEEASLFRKINEKGWIDTSGNLTGYRNAYPPGNGVLGLVVLGGADKVLDSSGLADFYCCSSESLWEEIMKKSFKKWCRSRFENAHVCYADKDVAFFDKHLCELFSYGCADLFQLSDFLETLPLENAQDGEDAQRIFLSHLESLGLPRFLGILKGKGKKEKSLHSYIRDAKSFFRYDVYMEASKRKKALEVIEAFSTKNAVLLKDNAFFTEEERGDAFSTDVEFVAALRNYVDTEDDAARKGLLQSDFVAISDKILKFKPSRSRGRPKETLSKVSGSPVEAVLAALWHSFGEYKKDENASCFPCKISLLGKLFKYHDIAEDSPTTAGSQDKAEAYIKRLLGGVDALVEEHLFLDCGGQESCVVTSKLFSETLDYAAAKNAEPYFAFQVCFFSEEDQEPWEYNFAWRLPESNSFRIAQELLDWAYHALSSAKKMADALPVYHFPYYEELILAKDDEETRQVLLYALRDRSASFTDLLTPAWRSNKDAMLKPMERLAHSYCSCIQKAAREGLFSIYQKPSGEETLGHQRTPWQDVRDCYQETAECFTSKYKDSPLGAMFMRAFLVIPSRNSQDENWVAQRHEESGIVTVLHPSLLEMLEDHVIYLFSCFRYAVAQELEKYDKRAFAFSRWQDYVDLGTIQMPLGGLIGDANDVVNTQVVGKELIHKILPLQERDDCGHTSLSTRLLLRYEGFDEEDASDTTLFQESRESRLFETLLGYYLDIHPHVQDGLSLAFYWNKEIQPIIAGIHAFLKKNKEKNALNLEPPRDIPYAISITIFTEAGEDAGVIRWMDEWKERWEASESEKKYAFYRSCRFSIAHRVVPGKSNQSRKDFARIMKESLDVDLVFFYDFIDAGAKGNSFESIGEFDVRGYSLKFPIMEKSFCKVDNPNEKFQRVRVISNPQFLIASKHLETMVRIKNKGAGDLQRHVLTGTGDFLPWKDVINAAHQCAEWVICIDPSVDDVLIRESAEKPFSMREIIGFGSGVGLHGELNYTISTEQCGLSEICFLIQKSVQERYIGWGKEKGEVVAKALVAGISDLSGVSLIKATGTGMYIHDFMAYSLVQKIFHKDGDDVLCHAFVSLDAYRHWFAWDENRPDLLLLNARLDKETNQISLEAFLIECKLAQFDQKYIERASKQIASGLRTLVPAFSPSSDDGVQGDDKRPDRRYWWLQLHRLLASKMKIYTGQREAVMASLERLAAGEYSISWNAAIVVFWTDRETEGLGCEPQEDVFAGEEAVKVQLISVGRDIVYRLCAEKEVFRHPFEQHAQENLEDTSQTEGTGKDSKVPSLEEELPSPIPPDEKDKNNDDVVEKAPSIPSRIFLGKALPGNREVFWEFGHSGLNNRHLLVFGSSGMGKTYAIQCLLCEMGRQRQNSLVMDYTNGFIPSQLEEETKHVLAPEQHIVQRDPLPISPFTPQSHKIGDGLVIPETPFNAAKRITDTFAQVYTSLGDQQYSHLVDAVEMLIEEKGDQARLEDLELVLESFADDENHDKTRALSVLSKIKPFIKDKPFVPGVQGCNWNDLFESSQHRCHVFQFAGMGKESSRLSIEFTLWDLYAFVRGSGNKDLPKVVVLDEAQNLDLTENSPVSKFLTEGRKFGISLILATQTMKNLQGEKLSRLFQAAHKLFFRPADTELQEHAKLLARTTGDSAPSWLENLSSLKKGECYSLGPSNNTATGDFSVKPFKIQVTSLGDRFPSHV